MTEIVFIPGGQIPSRELLAVWGLFAFSRHLVEVALPHGDGWICSRDSIEFRSDQWDWTPRKAGYWIGTPRTRLGDDTAAG